MTPAMRLMRRMLFLPVAEAEERERELKLASVELGRARGAVREATSRMQSKAADLKEAYDDLLGKLE